MGMTTTQGEHAQTALAHELFAAAQLAPGEGIEDAVSRIAAALTAAAAQPAAPQGAAYAELPTECDSPELCAVSKSCAGQFGTKRICASHGQAPAGAAGPCVICGSEEPFTGTCGSSSPRALCKQGAPTAQEAPAAATMPHATLADLHEGLAAKLHDGPARNLHLETAAALRAPAAGAVAGPSLQRLHNLLYTAQITTGETQRIAINAARVELSNLRSKAAEPIASRLSGEQIEAIPVWRNYVGLWPESRREIVEAVEDMLAAAPTTAAQADSVTAPADQQTGDDIQRYKESEMQVWFRPARMHGHPERTPIKATITKDRGNGIVDLTYDDGEFSGNARAVPNALRLPRNVREQVAVWWDVGFEMDFQTAGDNSLKKKKDGLPPQPAPAAQADSVLEDAANYRWWLQFFDTGSELPAAMREAKTGAELDAAIRAARKQGGKHD